MSPKLLTDENSQVKPLVNLLREAGHDVVTVNATIQNLAAVISAKRLLEAVGKDTYETEHYCFSH